MSPPAMLVERFMDCEIYRPTSGGKAGTGFNKTSALQVRKNGFIVKYVRFNVAESDGCVKALAKAREYIRTRKIDWVQM